jgi:hypothetical protein
MQTPRAYWSAWAKRLQRLKLDTFAAWLLEAAGPFALLSAQALYFFHPFIPSRQIKVLASMLEEEEEVQAFARFLRGEQSG